MPPPAFSSISTKHCEERRLTEYLLFRNGSAPDERQKDMQAVNKGHRGAQQDTAEAVGDLGGVEDGGGLDEGGAGGHYVRDGDGDRGAGGAVPGDMARGDDQAAAGGGEGAGEQGGVGGQRV